MKNNQPDNILLDLFTPEAVETLGAGQGNSLAAEHTFAAPAPGALPVQAAAEPAPGEDLRSFWRNLRSFFRSGKGGHLPMDAGGPHCYPALLAPYRNRPLVERNFPLWMEETAGGQSMPLRELLTERIARPAPGEGDAKILKDNLLRLETIVREKVGFAEDAYQAFAVMDEALSILRERLAIGGTEGETFANDLNNLRKHIPRQGLLLPFSPNLPFYLLAVLLRDHLTERRRALQERRRRLAAQLKDMLAVEQQKSPEAHSPEKLHGALDFAESFFNFEQLSSVMPSGGSAMPEERRQRIEKIVALLENTEVDFFRKNACLILGEPLAQSAGVDWERTFEKCTVLVSHPGQDCSLAMQVFDQKMAEYAALFAAIRMAELEVENHYDPEIHGDFFDHFNWRSFTPEEMAACPPVLLFTKDNSLIESELNEFSQLLASNRPVRMLVLKQDTPAATGSFSFRQELGAMAIAHRNAYVLQSASIAAGRLVEGFRQGLINHSPALFYIFSPSGREQSLSSPSLWTSAAVEGREFPGFVYNSEQSARWGSRFDILHNPQPESGWPQHRLSFQDDKGTEMSLDLPFTFADFAAQDGHYAGQFHLVPPAYWTDDLVLLGDYLRQPPGELYAKVPYIWVVDEQNQLQKAAVAWPLVLACQERLDFWHFLQENAGIHSYHVEQATGRLRQELEADFLKKTDNLQAAHAAELEKAKEEEGRAAMERLAAALLDLDTPELVTAAPSAPVKTAKAAAAPKPKTTEAAPEAEPPKAEAPKREEEEALSLGEPWIDTPLCTSCNDCINLNKRMFGYNENKQAYIADPKAGTFRELVLAAEKCPVSIIHPGAPLNPNEPGLEELVKRAEKFN